jgi:glucokinase
MQYLVPGLGTQTTIRLAWHGVRAGVLGAALLAAHELEAAAGVERPAAGEHDEPAASDIDTTEVRR